MNWEDRIAVDPQICDGSPCIKGSRVLVSVIVDNVAAGEPHGAIAAAYHVTRDDVRAALHYAAALTR